MYPDCNPFSCFQRQLFQCLPDDDKTTREMIQLCIDVLYKKVFNMFYCKEDESKVEGHKKIERNSVGGCTNNWKLQVVCLGQRGMVGGNTDMVQIVSIKTQFDTL